MKKIKLQLLILYLLWGLSSHVNAQVTIGSDELPSKGALLDLKEQKDATGGATSTRGLMLPRVLITTTKPAVGKLSSSISNPTTTVWDEEVHVGLVVYSVKRTSNGCNDGAFRGVYTWNGTIWHPVLTFPENTNLNLTSTDTYDGANSYITQPNTTLTIPVKRAFDIWTNYAGTSPTTGAVLDLNDVNNLTGTLTAEVVWQDGTSVTPSISGSGNTANILANIGGSEGNALIRLKINGVPLWQWHTWVTNQDPITTSQAYYTSDGEASTFMSSSLGSTSSNKGLYYQWGRPTPLKDGVLIHPQTDGTEQSNLTAAITTEQMINNASITSSDWYSATNNQFNNRWGTSTTKSAFDPCPYGWRVPLESPSESFDCVDNSKDIGYTYPLEGFLSNQDAQLSNNGTMGYYWIAKSTYNKGVMTQYNTSTSSISSYNKANAINVRCIKE